MPVVQRKILPTASSVRGTTKYKLMGLSRLLGLAEGLDSEISRLRGYLNLLEFYREYPYWT